MPDRVGRIVEVEAYGDGEDRASHARAGRTQRTAVMFGPSGRAYVYLVYGMHNCLNVVTGVDGHAGAVLIRAVEPLAGVEVMRSGVAAARRLGGMRARAASQRAPAAQPDERLAAGPGRLCAAFGIDRSMTGVDLCAPHSPLRIEPAPASELRTVIRTPRIGVAYAGHPWDTVPWRLVVASSPSISGPRLPSEPG